MKFHNLGLRTYGEKTKMSAIKIIETPTIEKKMKDIEVGEVFK